MKHSPPPSGVVSCMIILFYTEQKRVQHERPMACCETGGYERRAGMSSGDKNNHYTQPVPSSKGGPKHAHTHSYCTHV